MALQSRIENGVLVVHPQGPRLDAASAQGFKGAMVDFIHAGHRRVVLELSAVEFMDSTGLAALLSTMKTLDGSGELALTGLSEKVRKLFAITRLDRGVFRLFQNEKEAVSALQG